MQVILWIKITGVIKEEKVLNSKLSDWDKVFFCLEGDEEFAKRHLLNFGKKLRIPLRDINIICGRGHFSVQGIKFQANQKFLFNKDINGLELIVS